MTRRPIWLHGSDYRDSSSAWAANHGGLLTPARPIPTGWFAVSALQRVSSLAIGPFAAQGSIDVAGSAFHGTVGPCRL